MPFIGGDSVSQEGVERFSTSAVAVTEDIVTAAIPAVRKANRKHQQSLEGRLDHRDRQREWRERQRNRVTDQGRAAIPVSVSIPTRQAETAEDEAELDVGVCQFIVCIVCGRSGFYIETFYRSG